MRIPQNFYLRKLVIKCRNAKGVYIETVVHIYWNYRNTVRGIAPTAKRNAAKNIILKDNPDAEFFR